MQADFNRLPDILTLDEVARYLRVHSSTIYRMVQRREIPAFKIAGRWKFNFSDIDKWKKTKENL